QLRLQQVDVADHDHPASGRENNGSSVPVPALHHSDGGRSAHQSAERQPGRERPHGWIDRDAVENEPCSCRERQENRQHQGARENKNRAERQKNSHNAVQEHRYTAAGGTGNTPRTSSNASPMASNRRSLPSGPSKLMPTGRPSDVSP